MKTAAGEHSGKDAGQQGLIRRRRRCSTSTEEMWDNGDGEMGWKNGDGLGKYRQGATKNLRVYHHSDNLGVRVTGTCTAIRDVFGDCVSHIAI